MNTIEIDELTKYYGDVRGIEGVSIRAEAGEVLGFIGPNGAGKSTTLRTALGLLRPTSGSATILGESAKSPERLFERVGYLPSDVHYYERICVDRFLKIAAAFYDHDCSERMEQLTGMLGVDTSRRFGQLSSGNRKKVGIVQAFLHSPDVVILDEPTNGLDPLVRARFYELVAAERDRGTTILFSSHTLSEVQRHCTRITLIRDGKIVETGPIAEMRRKSVRRATLSGSASLLARIEAIAADTRGLTVENRNGTRVSILIHGEVGPLLAKLPIAEASDLIIEEPSLEELFMHYYEDET